MAFIKEITYEEYIANGKRPQKVMRMDIGDDGNEALIETGEVYTVHTLENPPVTERLWNQLYPKGVWLPTTKQTKGAIEMDDDLALKKCVECRRATTMQPLIDAQAESL